MFCREKTLTVERRMGAIATPVKCRSWLCPNCYEMRRANLIRLAASGKADRFITITCRRDQYATPDLAAAALAKAWARFVLHWRRKNKGAKGEYLCVIEAHKSGWPHLHILWRGPWIRWDYLKSQMTGLLNSPHVHIKRIFDGSSYASYVAKYIGKEAHKFGTTKRYWTSKNYELEQPTAAPKVFPKATARDIRNISIEELQKDWRRAGRLIWQVNADILGWGDPWWKGSRLPRQPTTTLAEQAGSFVHILKLPEDFDPEDG